MDYRATLNLPQTEFKMKASLNYQFTAYSEEEVSRQGQDFKLNRHRGSLLLPVKQDSRSDWSISLNAHGQEIKTDAFLPNTRESFPQHLWDLRLGLEPLSEQWVFSFDCL